MLQYYIILTIHLLAAIIFTGFCFTRLTIFPALNKLANAEEAKDTIMARASKIMPFMVLTLLITGLYLASITHPFSIFFIIKLLLAFIIIAGVAYSIGSRFLPYECDPRFGKYFPKYTPIAGLCIAACAKLMYV